MSYDKILTEADKLSSNELLWLIADLNHMQKVKEYDEVRPKLQGHTKGVVLSEKNELGFILTDEPEYDEGKLQLMAEPYGDKMIYALYTLHGIEIKHLFTLTDGCFDWEKKLAPKIRLFFEKGAAAFE
ncbi:hypothetical protein [Microscilla marina]|uniref:Uncharacterized protein n=1 Tax=Microscilla marina ATCC 23134 TaxID=313606 RepID=A1ZIP4_MICM2|nr:hypothetical protein [Microscilla marina]EAY29912.1 hypothetical protein M23134_05785 [Microscilla marina ATCC 23134]